MSEQDWKQRLEPFAEWFGTFYQQLYRRLEAMEDDDLRQLVRDSRMPNITNCGWTTYEVAPVVRKEARSILLARNAERREAKGDE